MKYHRILPLLVALLACTLWALPAWAAGDDESEADVLEQELLEGLDADLMDDLLPPADETAPPGEQGDEPARDALDEELLRDLGAEAEASEDPNPLSRAGRRMRQVENLIGRAKSGSDTQKLQNQIVEDLDTMIQLARQQAQRMQSNQQSQQETKRSNARQPGQPQPSQGGAPQDAPSEDSTERLGQADGRRPDMTEMNTLLKQLWGHLPEREREQVLNAQIEQFLPQYELLIEAYFKRLVEEQPGGP